MPIDLDDSISRELASARYLDPRIPTEEITASLPKGWHWSCDPAGHPIYRFSDGGEPWESSVHPAFFSSHSGQLPPGWDYRLDQWGAVFYVDHHTRTAQRVHPKADGVTNILTGLPNGWIRVMDHEGVVYYIEEKPLLATYQGSAMKSGGNEAKFGLSRKSTNGDSPPRIEPIPTGARETRQAEEQVSAGSRAPHI